MGISIGQVKDAFKMVKGDLQSLLGGANARILSKLEPLDITRDKYKIIRKFKIEDESFQFIVESKALPFTKLEESFVKELLYAFKVLLGGFTKEGYPVHIRTALMVSLMDISVAMFLRGERQSAFWSIQRLIQVLKRLSFERYEGAPATSGLVIYRHLSRNFFRKISSQEEYVLTKLSSVSKITPSFYDNPIAYRMVDGQSTVFTGNIRMQITETIRFKEIPRQDAVDRLSYRNILKLLQQSGDGSFAIFVNRMSEIERVTDQG
jgi:hypothetical protein